MPCIGHRVGQGWLMGKILFAAAVTVALSTIWLGDTASCGALDADGMAVKRMQSFLTLQPGEELGCVGCHEHRVRQSFGFVYQILRNLTGHPWSCNCR